MWETSFREHYIARRPRRNHSDEFKAKAVLSAIEGEKTLAELSSEFDIHQNQIIDWKNQLIAASTRVFSNPKNETELQVDLIKLHVKIADARYQLKQYFEFYNHKRPHSSLDKLTPNKFYYDQLPKQKQVA